MEEINEEVAKTFADFGFPDGKQLAIVTYGAYEGHFSLKAEGHDTFESIQTKIYEGMCEQRKNECYDRPAPQPVDPQSQRLFEFANGCPTPKLVRDIQDLTKIYGIYVGWKHIKY